MKKMMVIVPALALLLVGCSVPSVVADSPTSGEPAQVQSEVMGEDVLRAFLASEGYSPRVVDLQVGLAYEACNLADEIGAKDALEAVAWTVIDYPADVQEAAAAALGAGVTALCPEHAHAIEELGQ